MPKKERFRIYIAAYLILVKDGQVLLLKRANTGYQDGNYSLVAGHFEGAETAKQCIIREAEEEAGIKVAPADLEVVHVMHRYRSDREYIDIYLRTNTWSGNIINNEPNKCDDLKWFSLDGLPNNILPETKLTLENIKRKIFYGEIGW
jgi:8-oxo-dGTP pyrophosphatase MutT (NUDIX family)